MKVSKNGFSSKRYMQEKPHNIVVVEEGATLYVAIPEERQKTAYKGDFSPAARHPHPARNICPIRLPIRLVASRIPAPNKAIAHTPMADATLSPFSNPS